MRMNDITANAPDAQQDDTHLGVGQTFAKVFSKVAVVWRKPESCRKLRVGRRDGDHFSECGVVERKKERKVALT